MRNESIHSTASSFVVDGGRAPPTSTTTTQPTLISSLTTRSGGFARMFRVPTFRCGTGRTARDGNVGFKGGVFTLEANPPLPSALSSPLSTLSSVAFLLLTSCSVITLLECSVRKIVTGMCPRCQGICPTRRRGSSRVLGERSPTLFLCFSSFPLGGGGWGMNGEFPRVGSAAIAQFPAVFSAVLVWGFPGVYIVIFFGSPACIRS